MIKIHQYFKISGSQLLASICIGKGLKQSRSGHSEIALNRLAEWIFPGRTLISITQQLKDPVFLEYVEYLLAMTTIAGSLQQETGLNLLICH